MLSNVENSLIETNSEFFELTKDEYFVIDSNNLNSINSKLYGFALFDGNVVSNSNIKDDMELNGVGTYVHVIKTQGNIEISQDFNGSYGLFVFRKDAYFAVSNSFIYLVEYLRMIIS